MTFNSMGKQAGFYFVTFSLIASNLWLGELILCSHQGKGGGEVPGCQATGLWASEWRLGIMFYRREVGVEVKVIRLQ